MPALQAFLVFFVAHFIFKLTAYGGSLSSYGRVRLNVLEAVVTSCHVAGWLAGLQTPRGNNNYVVRDADNPSRSAPVTNLGPESAWEMLKLVRVVRVLTLALVVPGMKELVHDALRCGAKSCLAFVLCVLVTIALIAQQLFGDAVCACVPSSI